MPEFHLIHITEKLPPSLHGIGDYAFKTACKLRHDYHVLSSFIVFDSVQENNEILQDFPVYSLSKLGADLSDTLIKVLQNNHNKKNIVILHFDRGTYDNYIDRQGFQKNYFPKHLLRFLNSFKSRYRGTKLIIIFHEFLSPIIERRRDYVLRPLQNILMGKVIKSADAAISSNPVVERQLTKLVSDLNIFRCPVFSNIDEPGELSNKEEGSWVIFGSTGNLIKTLQKFIEQLPILQQSQPVYTVNVLGGQMDDTVLNLVHELKEHIPIVNYLPSILNQEVSKIFKVSKFCYMYYFTRNLLTDSALIFKSGVFATACSHGTITVFGNLGMEYAMGIFEHPGFVFMRDGQFKFPESYQLEELSSRIFRWYQEYAHSEKVTNALFCAVKNLESLPTIK